MVFKTDLTYENEIWHLYLCSTFEEMNEVQMFHGKDDKQCGLFRYFTTNDSNVAIAKVVDFNEQSLDYFLEHCKYFCGFNLKIKDLLKIVKDLQKFQIDNNLNYD